MSPRQSSERDVEMAFGTFIFLADPAVVEIAGLSGMDFVIVDAEHTGRDWQNMANMIRAGNLRGTQMLVRVGENRPNEILKCLELGADGIVLPFVRSADDVRAAFNAMRYSPHGERGTCTLTRAARYGSLRGKFVEHAEAESQRVVLVAQIEDKSGLAAVGEIADAMSPRDTILIGRSDLASSLGFPGMVDHPAVLEATGQIISTVLERGKAAPRIAIGVYAPEEVAKWHQLGCRMFFYSADTALLHNTFAASVEGYRTAATGSAARNRA